MNGFIKFYETDSDTIYMLNDERGLVTIPKNLSDNVRMRMSFKDSSCDRNSLISEIKNVNDIDFNGVFIFLFIDSKSLEDNNTVGYLNNLNFVKESVNRIYNALLKEGKLKKENFIRKIELLNSDNKYKNFIDWLCLQNPRKFEHVYLSKLQNSEAIEKLEQTQGNVFINNNVTGIFNETNSQSAMTSINQSSTQPVVEQLSIGNSGIVSNNFNNQSNLYNDGSGSSGGPANVGGPFVSQGNPSISNSKVLVKTLPIHQKNAFINWYTIVFILIICLVIGISFSIYLIK